MKLGGFLVYFLLPLTRAEWVRRSFILVCVSVSCVEILAHLPIAYMHLGLSFVLLHLVEKEYREAS